MRKIIVTGDDFGLALPINEAIIEANLRGILTTASLMVGAAFAGDAVERALQTPSLKTGLHLVLVEGRAILKPREIPDLVNNEGEFCLHPAQCGFKYFFYPGIRKQLEAEIRAQFEAFIRTGLSLDHVNAHNHMHLHPTILRLILKVGREYGLRAVRFPYEPPLRSWRASGNLLWSRLASSALLHPWIILMKHMLRQARIRYNDCVFGLADSGSMSLDLTLRFLQHLPAGVTELYFHPAAYRCEEIDRTMPSYHHKEEFKALISERLLNAIEEAGIQRISFCDL